MNIKIQFHVLAALAFAAGTGSALRAAPAIQFDKELLDFGNVQSGTPINATFRFKNVGDADLDITGVRPGCGCTKAEARKTVLTPGESSTIEAVFNSIGYSGPILKGISVTTNDPTHSLLSLQIKANIAMAAVVKPSVLNFGDLRVNGVKTFTLTVTPADPKSFAITKVTSLGDHVTIPGFRKVETNAGAYWEVYVVVKAGKTPGRVMENVRFETTLGNSVALTAMVYGNAVQ